MIDEKKLIEVMLKCREREHGTPKAMIDWFIDVIEACPKLDENLFDKKKLIEDIDNSVAGLTNIQINRIADIIDSQPKVGEWIPCSERLPELYEAWSCMKQSECVLVAVKWWDGDITENVGWYNENGSWSVESNNCKVIAWQPLPEPYKGE